MQFNLGNWSKNMLLDWSDRDAAYRQTEQEHDDALRQYVKPGMTTEDLLNAMADGNVRPQVEAKDRTERHRHVAA